MQDELLTFEECEELAEALLEEAAALPNGAKKEGLLKLAHGYHNLANMKRSTQGELGDAAVSMTTDGQALAATTANLLSHQVSGWSDIGGCHRRDRKRQRGVPARRPVSRVKFAVCLQV